MTAEEAIEIRDRAVRLGLKNCCPTCAEDIETLTALKGGVPGAFAIVPPAVQSPESRRDSVLGVTMEDAARRLRRSLGRGSAA